MINPAAVAVLVHAALARAGCSRSARDGAPRYSIPAAVPWYAALSRVSSVPDLRGTGSPTPASEPTAAGPTVPGYNQTAAAVAGGADPGSRKPSAVRPWIPGGRGKPKRDGGWIAASEAGTGGCGGFFDCQPDAFPVYFP